MVQKKRCVTRLRAKRPKRWSCEATWSEKYLYIQPKVRHVAAARGYWKAMAFRARAPPQALGLRAAGASTTDHDPEERLENVLAGRNWQ